MRGLARAAASSAVLAAALVSAAAVPAAASTPAPARTEAPWVGLRPEGTGPGMGVMVIDGRRVLCVTQGRPGQWRPAPSRLTAPKPRANTAWAAYLLHKHLGTGDDAQAFALAHLVKLGADGHAGLDPYRDAVEKSWAGAQAGRQGWGGRGGRYDAARGRQLKDAVNSHRTAMLADARRNAGPYAASVRLTRGTGTATVDSLTVTSASGASQLGVPVTLTLDGPAAFAGGKRTLETRTAATTRIPVTLSGPGEVRVRARTGPLPLAVMSHPSADGRLQEVASAQLGPVETQARLAAAHQPMVRTQTSSARVSPGTGLRDTLVITGGAPGSTITYRNRLWGPVSERPTTSPSVPEGVQLAGEVSGTVTLDAKGSATVVSAPVTVREPGWYSWQEELLPAGPNLGTKGAYAAATEVTLVEALPEAPATATPATSAASAAPAPTTAAPVPSESVAPVAAVSETAAVAAPVQGASIRAGEPEVGHSPWTATGLGALALGGGAVALLARRDGRRP